jgi:hypothetical protein
MKLLCLDPGTEQTAYVVWDSDSQTIGRCGMCVNSDIIQLIEENLSAVLVQEMIASYGMAVGREVFETCVWIGRFEQVAIGHGMKTERLYRRECKMELCNSVKAKDSNIRQALIDRFGAPGTKKNPGRLYGVSKDIWSALAVAVTYCAKSRM